MLEEARVADSAVGCCDAPAAAQALARCTQWQAGGSQCVWHGIRFNSPCILGFGL